LLVRSLSNAVRAAAALVRRKPRSRGRGGDQRLSFSLHGRDNIGAACGRGRCVSFDRAIVALYKIYDSGPRIHRIGGAHPRQMETDPRNAFVFVFRIYRSVDDPGSGSEMGTDKRRTDTDAVH